MDEIEIDVAIVGNDWMQAVTKADVVCRTAARAALNAASKRPSYQSEVSILLTDDEQIQTLNATYRKVDRPTNVLSFANQDGKEPKAGGPVMLGDVVVAFGVASNEAKEQGKKLSDHLAHLVVHGVLHLLGHDHEDEDEARSMEAIEASVLAGLDIANPYTTADRMESP